MTGREIAAALYAAAQWIDESLAAGVPPKWVAQQAAAAASEIRTGP